MPIKIQADLPARRTLENEHIFVMLEERASHQDIRPLKIAIVNLMPTKIATETQLLRLLSNSPLQTEISLIRMENHQCKYTEQEHLERFYISSSQALSLRFDGMIITGAPVEHLPFEEVDYWEELCRIMDYAEQNVFCTLYICWAAQAGLYHHYGIPKNQLKSKLSGIYPSRAVQKYDPLLRGFDDMFPTPQSRHTHVFKSDIQRISELVLLAESDEAGVVLVKSESNRQVFMSGHLEYDAETLAREYERDLDKNPETRMPENYFPHDDPSKQPLSTWRSTANLFYTNWLNYYVYQRTPFGFI